MAVDFTDFTTSGSFASDNYLVGYDVDASGGEKKWKYSTLLKSVSADIPAVKNVADSSTVNLHFTSSTGTLSADVIDGSITNAKLAFDGGSFSLRNKLINGDFDIWQRGTSTGTWIAPVAKYYLADRWSALSSGTGGNGSMSRQSFTVGQTDVPNNPTFFLRWQITSAPTGQIVGQNWIEQRIEDVRTLAGEEVTVSFWAKGTGTFPGFYLTQTFGSGGSPQVIYTLATNIILNSTWTKYTYTTTLQSIGGKNLIAEQHYMGFTIQAPLNSTFTLDLAQVQLEEGSVATPFETRPIGTELALCQRYYEKGYVNGWELAIFSDYNQRYTMSYVYKTSKRSLPTLITVGTQIVNYRYQNSTRTNGSYEGASSAGYLDHANLVMTLPDIPSQSNGFGTLARCDGFAVDSEL